MHVQAMADGQGGLAPAAQAAGPPVHDGGQVIEDTS